MRVITFLFIVVIFGGICFASFSDFCGSAVGDPDSVPAPRDDSSLVLVQLLVRHGARSPKQCWDTYDGWWECDVCPIDIADETGENVITSPGRLHRINYIPGRNVVPGNCPQSNLLPEGWSQLQDLGSVFRELYIDKLSFLSDTANQDELFVRHDINYRTLQSAEAFMSGLYPYTSGYTTTEIFNFWSMDYNTEDLMPNSKVCPIISDFTDDAEATELWKAHEIAITDPLQLKIDEALNTSDVDLDTVFDCSMSSYCHGVALPATLTDDLLEELYEDRSWCEAADISYPNITYNARLSMGFLLNDWYDHITNKLNNGTGAIFELYSAHDSSIMSILNGLGVWDQVWPAFGSYLLLETSLYNGDAYLRLVYNGVELSMRTCPDVYCPLQYFESLMEELVPSNPDVECYAS